MNRSSTPFSASHDLSGRRHFLVQTGALAAGLLLGGDFLRAMNPTETDKASVGPTVGKESNVSSRYKIGVCDWMILKRQKLGAFQLAKEIGVDGVEVDMGSLGTRDSFDNKLVDPALRQQFLDKARELNLAIASVAMSGFYAQSFPLRPTAEAMVRDCLGTMSGLKVKVAFLPLGVEGDLVKHPEVRAAVVTRLKAIAPLAEKAGVVIGVETALDAAGEVKLFDEVGSPAICSYFNFANPIQAGRDLTSELKTLGKNRIAQIHCTNQDGAWLQNDPQIDLHKVKQTLDELGWGGWLVIERSRDVKDVHNVKSNYSANAAYLKSIFQPA